MPSRPRQIAEQLDAQPARAGAAQSAGRQLGSGRARHRLPPGPRRRIPGRRRQGHRLRQGARRQAGQLPGRHQAGRTSPTAQAYGDAGRQPAFAAGELQGRGHPPADRADQHLRHPRLLPVGHRAGAGHHRARSAPTTSASSTTSITCSAWRASSRPPSRPTCRGSATSSSPTIRAATSRAPARSTTASCSAMLDEIGYDGLDRLRVQAEGRHRRRPGLDRRARPDEHHQSIEQWRPT